MNVNNSMYMSRSGNNMNERRLEAARRRYAGMSDIPVTEKTVETPAEIMPLLSEPANRREPMPESDTGYGKEALMNQIMMHDFAAAELNLYLDTHPNDMNALMLHRNTAAHCKALRAEYEARFGPITHLGAESNTHWTWEDNPWPWDAK